MLQWIINSWIINEHQLFINWSQISVSVFIVGINLQLGSFRLQLSRLESTSLMRMKILNEIRPQPEELLVIAEKADAKSAAWSYLLQPVSGASIHSAIHHSNNSNILVMSSPSIPEKAPGHSYSNNVHVIFTEFSRPFAYTTSSWLENGQCEKDMNLFKMYSTSANHKTFLKPAKSHLRKADASFVYHFQFIPDGPLLQIILPGFVANLSMAMQEIIGGWCCCCFWWWWWLWRWPWWWCFDC